MSIIQRRSLMGEASRLYLYRDGDEFSSLTGGWRAVNYCNGSYAGAGAMVLSKGTKTLDFTQGSGGGSRLEWYKKGWTTQNMVSIAGRKRVVVVFANDFTIPIIISPTDPSQRFPSMVGLAIISSVTDNNVGQRLTNEIATQIYDYGTEIKAGRPYALNIAGLSGLTYPTVYFGIYASGGPYAAKIKEIYFE